MRLRLEIDIKRHSKCNRLYLKRRALLGLCRALLSVYTQRSPTYIWSVSSEAVPQKSWCNRFLSVCMVLLGVTLKRALHSPKRAIYTFRNRDVIDFAESELLRGWRGLFWEYVGLSWVCLACKHVCRALWRERTALMGVCTALSYMCNALLCEHNHPGAWQLKVIVGEVCCSVLQCVAVCCSVLQCVAVCCSVLQCVVLCCSVYWGQQN